VTEDEEESSGTCGRGTEAESTRFELDPNLPHSEGAQFGRLWRRRILRRDNGRDSNTDTGLKSQLATGWNTQDGRTSDGERTTLSERARA